MPRSVFPRFAVLALAFFAAVSTNPARAQDESSSPLHAGARALMFQVTDNFTLQSLDGTVFSYKQHSSATRALRFGLSFDASGLDTEQDLDVTNETPADTVSEHPSTDGNNGNFGGGISAYQLRYASGSRSRVLPYLGLGLTFDASRRTRESTSRSGQPANSTYSRDWHETILRAGPAAILGVEWFASRGVSLHGEYGVSVQYRWERDRSTEKTLNGGDVRRTTEKITTKGWSVSPHAVRLGVSAYF